MADPEKWCSVSVRPETRRKWVEIARSERRKIHDTYDIWADHVLRKLGINPQTLLPSKPARKRKATR